MNTNRPATVRGRVSALLSLVAVFGLTATLTFGARRILGRPLDAQPTATELSTARLETAQAIPRLPADTEEKLMAALEPVIPPLNVSSDPFSDRAGIGNPNLLALASAAKPMSLVGTVPTGPVQPLMPDRMARLSQWQQSVRAAAALRQPLPPITNAYLISEIAPTGKVDMNGQHGAWLYIDSEKRTISANVGARFYDGTLVGVNDNGVQFRTSANQVKTIPWNRQDDFSSAPPTIEPPRPPQPTNPATVRPVSEFRAPRGFRPITVTNEYDHLQQAVKTRYSKPDVATTLPETKSDELASTTTSEEETKSDKPTRPNYHHPYRAPAESGPASEDNAIDADAIETPTPPATASATPAPVVSKAQPVTAAPVSTPTIEAAKTGPSTSSTTAVNRSSAETAQTSATPDKNPLCAGSYRGAKISLTNESGRPVSLLAFINRLNSDYNANIVLDYDIQETPVRLTITDAPWTSVLRTILDLNDLDIVCLDGSIVQVAKRAKISQINEQRKKNAPIVREVFKLRYLQPTAGGRANLAGQAAQTPGGTIQTLEDAIRDILKAGGDARGEARRVPGRNELLVAATQQQMDEIRDLIARVDRPGYQVLIKALVYTANENRLRDIGSQLSVAGFNLSNTNIGGVSTLPNVSQGGSSGGTGSGSGTAGSNPGGIPGLLSGMRQPSNGLGANNPLVTIGGGMVFPGGQFALQITAAQQQGAINIQSRPMGIVADGETLDLTRGIQIPVVTTAIAGGAVTQTGQVQFIEASRLTQITPQVAEDDQGKPSFVTLNLRLEDNSVDTSLGTFNGVPGVNRQSLQTVLRLRDGETAVIGGLSADQVSNAKSKVPGLGSLPIIGHAFKRRQTQESRDRLYFAITVEVIPQDSPLPNIEAPSDAVTSQPPPPAAQKPSPFQKRP